MPQLIRTHPNVFMDTKLNGGIHLWLTGADYTLPSGVDSVHVHLTKEEAVKIATEILMRSNGLSGGIFKVTPVKENE